MIDMIGGENSNNYKFLLQIVILIIIVLENIPMLLV